MKNKRGWFKHSREHSDAARLGWSNRPKQFETKPSFQKETKHPNWSKRQVTFQMISDDRFTKDISSEIDRLHNKVLTVLKDSSKFQTRFSGKRLVTFDGGNNKQYRITYYVKINLNNTKWNDLYSAINSINPVPYDFT